MFHKVKVHHRAIVERGRQTMFGQTVKKLIYWFTLMCFNKWMHRFHPLELVLRLCGFACHFDVSVFHEFDRLQLKLSIQSMSWWTGRLRITVTQKDTCTKHHTAINFLELAAEVCIKFSCFELRVSTCQYFLLSRCQYRYWMYWIWCW